MQEYTLSDELYREYEWEHFKPLNVDGDPMYEVFLRKYRIDNPVTLFFREGGTTHRVLDENGVVHCVPAPGQMGCVLRWEPREVTNPVQF